MQIIKSEKPNFDSGEYTWPPTPFSNGIDTRTGRPQNDSQVRLEEGDTTILRDPSLIPTSPPDRTQLLE